MTKRANVLVLLFLVSAPIWLHGQTPDETSPVATGQAGDTENTEEQLEDNVTGENTNGSEDNDGSENDDSSKEDSPGAAKSPEPEPLKKPAAKPEVVDEVEDTVFIPTEEISDDSPVPFPVDI